MFSTTTVLGFLLSTLIGILFHLLRGGGLYRLLFYLLLSWIGFAIGHFIGLSYDLTLGKIGELHVGSGSTGSLILLIIGNWLSPGEAKPNR